MTSPIFRQAASLYHECRDDFADHLDALLSQAEEATRGVLLSDRGRRAGVDPMSLLYGPAARLAAYGSEELQDFLRDRGRLTFAEFEQQWLAGRMDLAS